MKDPRNFNPGDLVSIQWCYPETGDTKCEAILEHASQDTGDLWHFRLAEDGKEFAVNQLHWALIGFFPVDPKRKKSE